MRRRVALSLVALGALALTACAGDASPAPEARAARLPDHADPARRRAHRSVHARRGRQPGRAAAHGGADQSRHRLPLRRGRGGRRSRLRPDRRARSGDDRRHRRADLLRRHPRARRGGPGEAAADLRDRLRARGAGRRGGRGAHLPPAVRHRRAGAGLHDSISASSSTRPSSISVCSRCSADRPDPAHRQRATQICSRP